ncbi:putative phosphodiesterase [Enterococcus sp. PF1-24]|uniref:metallophosphoesterase family protein n=1 Tax=unclassified Enterococcus TaxID=2608891 RepID=UPI0024745344|nr:MULTISPECIES: metallophosphoesterase family protein [unclassified Enterococcus]MDH6364123.1 putative phosphodiesterase [Enterococcus sp. PFB1-1]MDH6401224.1 putative phosphodiesterase [Enterococcus sp. PF1-24]
MNHKIAVFADVHGNQTALEAVLADAKKENVTDYWFVGDLIMPGPAGQTLFDIFTEIKPTVYVMGNWEESFLEVLAGKIDVNDASDIYLSMFVKTQYERLRAESLDKIKHLPKYVEQKVNHLRFGLAHHLPTKTYGNELNPANEQANYDAFFENKAIDVAIYAHTHQQLIRYSSNGQIIINPGTVGQPFSNWQPLSTNLRAQYALIEVDEIGITNIQMKRVGYDVEKEYQRAKAINLPYLPLYKELLETGKLYTHNTEVLQKINEEHDYQATVAEFLKNLQVK